MNLSDKKCIPCEGGVSKIPTEKLQEYLDKVDGWSLTKNETEIEKIFKFKNFARALEFVNKVGEIAETENHHPDIEFGWGYCKIRLSTHAIAGLHENDFIVAIKIDGIVNA